MKIELLKEEKEAATEKWREYKDAAKKTRDPLYTDLKKVYAHIKSGRAVIDIFDAIKAGGIHAHNLHPKMAIARATEKEVRCIYQNDGTVEFFSGNESYKRGFSGFKDWLPTHNGWRLDLKAPVPIIPPRLRPNKLTDDYYILWEVDSWTPVPSRDPYLLRKITPRLFVVLSAWDLTDIEIKVMQGRI
jgi:hypothetical protein